MQERHLGSWAVGPLHAVSFLHGRLAEEEGSGLCLAAIEAKLAVECGQKPVSSHLSPDHHFHILFGLDCLLLGHSSPSFVLFNKDVDFTALRHMFS